MVASAIGMMWSTSMETLEADQLRTFLEAAER
jgi:hypothetical protein